MAIGRESLTTETGELPLSGDGIGPEPERREQRPHVFRHGFERGEPPCPSGSADGNAETAGFDEQRLGLGRLRNMTAHQRTAFISVSNIELAVVMACAAPE